MEFGTEFGKSNSYRTAEGDRVYLFTDTYNPAAAQVWWVIYIYADSDSPQFIRFESEDAAWRLFSRTRNRDGV